MNIEKSKKIYSIDALRIVAAFFVVVIHFPFTGIIGQYVWANAYFAVPFFYMVSGYFIKANDNVELEKKVIRRTKHISKLFIYTACIYLFINILYFIIYKGISIYEYMDQLLSIQRLLDFLVLNMWPLGIGGPIWFLQAMVYSYIIIWILVKTNLIKFDLQIAIALLIVNAIFGEFSTLLGMPLIKANFFTRALPYMLIGRVVSKNIYKIKRLNKVCFYVIVFASIVICLLEYITMDFFGVLGYTGHYQGNTLLAMALLVYAVQNTELLKETALYNWGRKYSLPIYLIHQPVGVFIMPYINNLAIIKPVIIFVVSFLLAYVYDVIKNIVKRLINNKE